MRKVQLFIATSIDGFIACSDGSISWLFTDADYGYDAFFEQVDTVLIGRKTFQQVLEFGEWPYPGRTAYIFTHNTSTKAPDGISDLTFTSRPPSDVVKGLLEQPGKNIWVVGGASVTGDLLCAGLLDEMVLSVHPIVLGKGVPLVSAYSQPGPEFDYWQLAKAEAFPSGLAQLSYTRRPPADPAADAAPATAAAGASASEKLDTQAPPPAAPSEASGEPAEPKTPTAPTDSTAPKARDAPYTDQGSLASPDSPS